MKTLATIILIFLSLASEAATRTAYASEHMHNDIEMQYFGAERIFIGGMFALVILLLAYRLDAQRYFGIKKVKLFIDQ